MVAVLPCGSPHWRPAVHNDDDRCGDEKVREKRLTETAREMPKDFEPLPVAHWWLYANGELCPADPSKAWVLSPLSEPIIVWQRSPELALCRAADSNIT